MQALTRYLRYNPYTEPSMEIFSYHKGLNKLIEIGNSGIFRPEMLEVCHFLSCLILLFASFLGLSRD